MQESNAAAGPEPKQALPQEPGGKFPAGATEADRQCWLCEGETQYRNCKIICKNCGFTRDCSDP